MRPLRKPALAAIAILLATQSAWADSSSMDPSSMSSENPFRFSISIAPAFGWPHFNKLNDALSFTGNEYTNFSLQDAAANTSMKASGFKSITMDYGGQIAVAHEFDEDMRAGLAFNTTVAYASESLKYTMLPSATYWTSTDFVVSQSITLPLFQVGIFLHRMFRFEEEPNLRLYMGGWGNYGTLVSATLKGKSYNSTYSPRTEQRYTATLVGNSWGAGAVGGVEYAVASILTAFIESGWEYFIIDSVERSGTQTKVRIVNGTSSTLNTYTSNNPKWANGDGKPIPLDFGGVFIRFGIRLGLGL